MNDQTIRFFQLKKHLLDFGYYSFQIDEIVKDATGTSGIENLNSEQQANLIAELEYYVKFALKCQHK